MAQVTDPLLARIVDRLVEALHPRQIYLFGSHAAGKTHPHSDVDLLIVVDDDAGPRRHLCRQARRALRDICIPMDILVFHRKTMKRWDKVRFSIQHEATTRGKMLYAA